MHPDLHRYLDGELPRDELGPDLLAELEEWDALESAARELGAARAPGWLEDKVMAALPEAVPSSGLRRLWSWWLEPRPVTVRPAGVALAGAAFILLLAVWPRLAPPVPPDAPGAVANGRSADDALVYVQFVFVHPGAAAVSVAGDFNGWDTERHQLRDAGGEGIWTGLIPVPAGIHKYMFVVDGEEWVTDPHAERYADDGFGMRNAVLAVGRPPERAS